MEINHLDILGICESRWGDNTDFWSDNFRFINSGKKQGTNGVAILMNKKWGTCVENTYHVNDRILVIKIKAVPVNMIDLFQRKLRIPLPPLKPQLAPILLRLFAPSSQLVFHFVFLLIRQTSAHCLYAIYNAYGLYPTSRTITTTT